MTTTTTVPRTPPGFNITKADTGDVLKVTGKHTVHSRPSAGDSVMHHEDGKTTKVSHGGDLIYLQGKGGSVSAYTPAEVSDLVDMLLDAACHIRDRLT